MNFEAEGREFAKFLRSLEKFIERSEKILVTEYFFNSFLDVLISNKLEQLEFKMEKIVEI